MYIYSKPDGGYPLPIELGLKDFYHDKDGNYIGIPEFVPIEYKGNEVEYFRIKHGHDENWAKNYVAPKFDTNQCYKPEKEAACDNLSWGRNHYAERCHSNKEYEAWLNEWN